jgi:hypothetical protein
MGRRPEGVGSFPVEVLAADPHRKDFAMKRFRLLIVAALASSTLFVGAAPAQARCLPEYALVCNAIVLVCKVTKNPCAA